MNANELRLRNLFEYEGCIYSANLITDNFVYGKNINGFAPGQFPIDKINPVDFTEEWALRAGFNNVSRLHDVFFIPYCKNFSDSKFKYTLTIVKDLNWITKGSISEFSFDNNVKRIYIQYVHELQNLYFTLAGSELFFFSTEP